MTKFRLAIVLFLASLSVATAQPSSNQSIYIEPQDGFDTYLAAAITKKGVPVDVVEDKAKATLILRPSAVDTRKESTGGKIARCLFAYCAGIEDRGSVSVQLIEVSSSKMVWAYAVNKQRGHKNDQAMAEAVAKHLKAFIAQK